MDGSRLVDLVDARGEKIATPPPAIPGEFLQTLRAFDADLFVLWSPTRERYLIHQCTQHVLEGPKINNGHTQLCRSVYVVICQDRDGFMLPLNDRVMSTLREMRAHSESYGGQTPQGLANFRRHTAGLDREIESKRDAKMRDNLAHNRKWHRVQFNKLHTMFQQFMGGPPNK
jgi:hypothetical protein